VNRAGWALVDNGEDADIAVWAASSDWKNISGQTLSDYALVGEFNLDGDLLADGFMVAGLLCEGEPTSQIAYWGKEWSESLFDFYNNF
jgi:hypothetical protein